MTGMEWWSWKYTFIQTLLCAGLQAKGSLTDLFAVSAWTPAEKGYSLLFVCGSYSICNTTQLPAKQQHENYKRIQKQNKTPLLLGFPPNSSHVRKPFATSNGNGIPLSWIRGALCNRSAQWSWPAWNIHQINTALIETEAPFCLAN